jgi:glycosyltransferase involved in cell wall biosynthesis
VPAVSVLMPYRDAAATLEEAARSILAQEGVDLELVAIDDGSRDDGAARIQALAATDERVVRVQGEGRGIASALGLGLRHARARVIARMDADDVALPARLRLQLEALGEGARLGVVGTQVAPLGDCGEGMRRYIEWQNGIVTPEDHVREIFVESPLCHPSVALRREALEEVGGWQDGRWAEDYDLWLRLDSAGWKLAKVPEVLLLWRQGQGGRLTFSDPRYAPERFTEARANYLAPRLVNAARPVVVWGAGPTGRRLARALERHGLHAARFVDIDPRKIGRIARGVRIVPPAELRAGEETVVVAVGARGARELVRENLLQRGFAEGTDFVCAA